MCEKGLVSINASSPTDYQLILPHLVQGVPQVTEVTELEDQPDLERVDLSHGREKGCDLIGRDDVNFQNWVQTWFRLMKGMHATARVMKR